MGPDFTVHCVYSALNDVCPYHGEGYVKQSDTKPVEEKC